MFFRVAPPPQATYNQERTVLKMKQEENSNLRKSLDEAMIELANFKSQKSAQSTCIEKSLIVDKEEQEEQEEYSLDKKTDSNIAEKNLSSLKDTFQGHFNRALLRTRLKDTYKGHL